MSVDHYERMVYSQIHDEGTYKCLDSNKDRNIQTALTKLIKKYKDSFTDTEYKCLISSNFKPSQFYGLPKIHKSKILAEETIKQNNEIINFKEPNDLKLRPIISGPECPTRNLSNIIDKKIKPLLVHVTSYIKNSIDFLNKCKRETSENAFLVTFDVCSLYTSIPHTLGIEDIKYFLEEHPESIDSRFKSDFIIQDILFILKNNTFTFNG